MSKQTAAAIAVDPGRHAMIPIAELVESPLNHRKTFDKSKLAELAESIRKHGVISPVLARPTSAGGYELVFGHRRYRAAELAGLTEIPATVREMDDREVLELQLIENVQREDVHPLEEADGYKLLIDHHGYDVDGLAAKLGKSKAHVYGRLKLATMLPAAKEGFHADKFNAGVAMVIARVPEHHQEEALKLVRNPGWRPAGEKEPLSAREALNLIRNRLMLQLRDAPFPVGDAQLVPATGACKACPKRTGCQPQLFADVDEADTCTDPTCFQSKKDAHWERERAKAEAQGLRVIDDKKAKAMLGHGSSRPESPYVSLEEKKWDYSGSNEREVSLKKVLGKSVKPVAIARDERGVVHHLVDKAEAAKAIKKSAPGLARALQQDVAESAKSDDPAAAERARKAAELEKAKRRLMELVQVAVIEKAVAAIEKKGLSAEVLRAMLEEMCSDGWADDAAERRLGAGVDTQELVDRLPKMNQAQLGALVFEVVLCGRIGYASEALEEIARIARVDTKAVLKEVKQKADAEARAIASGGKCVGCGCTGNKACPGGCHWIAGAKIDGKPVDLCSNCSAKADKPASKSKKA
jgi:ParB/RepB/Spo0J family partition protein